MSAGSRRCPADSISVGGELARVRGYAFTFLSGFIASYTQTDCVVDTEWICLLARCKKLFQKKLSLSLESLLKILGGGIDTAEQI